MRCLDLQQNAECSFVADAAIALGNFDGVHIGHRAIFDALGGEFARAVFTFADLRRDGLICTPDEKLRQIGALGVRYALVADFADVRRLRPARFVELLCAGMGARRLACGYNFTFGAGGSAGADELRELAAGYGVETVVVPAVEDGGEPVSSTRVREMLAGGDMDGAARLLGRRYGFSLPVIRGKTLGREHGCPTINQAIPACLAPVRYGVYASLVTFGGETRGGVTNVGVRPTVGGGAVCAETHIFDFDGELYGETVGVELCAFIRPERRFASVEELFAQVAADAACAKGLVCKVAVS